MKVILRNILVTISAILIGAMVNGLLVQLGFMVIAPPAGYDFNTEQGMSEGMAAMEPRHFVFPFLAHAVGTLLGGLIAARFAANGQFRLAMIISTIFFLGGLYMVATLPSPIWFTILDLTLAYFPMGWLAYRLGRR